MGNAKSSGFSGGGTVVCNSMRANMPAGPSTLRPVSKGRAVQFQRPMVDFMATLPPEVAFCVLQYLSIEDFHAVRLVCRAWYQLGDSEAAWQHVCSLQWPCLTHRPAIIPSWKDTHKIMRYGAAVTNARGIEAGVKHFSTFGFVQCTPEGEAELLDNCVLLNKIVVGQRLVESEVVLDLFMHRQRFHGVFLTDALRTVFAKAVFPGHSSLSISPVLRKFVDTYIRDNPSLTDERHHIHVLCYSLILLSVDLYNPHVKCKMSRREFIKNNSFMPFDQEYLIRLYNDIYIWGHIAEPKKQRRLRDALAKCTEGS